MLYAMKSPWALPTNDSALCSVLPPQALHPMTTGDRVGRRGASGPGRAGRARRLVFVLICSIFVVKYLYSFWYTLCICCYMLLYFAIFCYINRTLTYEAHEFSSAAAMERRPGSSSDAACWRGRHTSLLMLMIVGSPHFEPDKYGCGRSIDFFAVGHCKLSFLN